MQNRVLFIEEESLIAEPKKILELAGFQVLNAQVSDQIFKLIHQAIPDVIVTDASLTSINGYDLCKKLKANKESQAIPLIVLCDQRQMEDAYLYAGAQQFIMKPIDAATLSECISLQLNKSVNNTLRKSKVIIHNTQLDDAKRMKYLLETNGYWDVDVCESSAELVYKTMSTKPDIILIDLFMLDAAPEEVVRSIRSYSRFRNASILTYYSQKPKSEDDLKFQAQMIEVRFIREHCKEAGATDYIGPFSEDTLVSLVSEYRKITV